MRKLALLLIVASAPAFSATHTYWRLKGYSSAQMLICQLQFYDASNVQISTAGGTASASSTAAGSAANAFNGTTNCSTVWAGANSANESVQMQFASPVDVDNIKIISGGSGFGAGWGPVDAGLEYSDNNSTWTVANTWYGRYDPTGGTHTDSLTPANARPATLGIGWRLKFSGSFTTGSCVGLSGLKFFGAGGAQLTTTRYAAIPSSIPNAQVGGMVAMLVTTSPWFSASTGPPATFEYEFPALQGLTSLAFSMVNQSSCTKPLTFDVEYSTDNSIWTLANSFTTTWPTTAEQTFTITGGPAVASFVPQTGAFIVGP